MASTVITSKFSGGKYTGTCGDVRVRIDGARGTEHEARHLAAARAAAKLANYTGTFVAGYVDREGGYYVWTRIGPENMGYDGDAEHFTHGGN